MLGYFHWRSQMRDVQSEADLDRVITLLIVVALALLGAVVVLQVVLFG